MGHLVSEVFKDTRKHFVHRLSIQRPAAQDLLPTVRSQPGKVRRDLQGALKSAPALQDFRQLGKARLSGKIFSYSRGTFTTSIAATALTH